MSKYYEVLGVAPSASADAIKAAYRRALKAHHPDLHGGDVAAEAQSRSINAAYEVLRDPASRHRYDWALRHRRTQRWRLVLIGLFSATSAGFGTFLLLSMATPQKPADPELRTAQPEGEPPRLADVGRTAKLEELPLARATRPSSPTLLEQNVGAASPGVFNPAVEPPAVAHRVTIASKDELWRYFGAAPQSLHSVFVERWLGRQVFANRGPQSLNGLVLQARRPFADRVSHRLAQLDLTPQFTNSIPANGRSGENPAAQDVSTEHKDSERAGGGNEPISTALAPHPSPPDANSQSTGLSAATAIAPQHPATPQDVLARAHLLEVQEDWDGAFLAYSSVIQLDETNAEAYQRRSRLWLRRGDSARSLTDLDRAIRLSFSNPDIYCARGAVWLGRGRYDRAIADFTQAIKLSPEFAIAYYYRGVALRRKSEFKMAIADLDTALRLEPTLTDARHNRELALLEKSGSLDEAP